MIRSTLPSGVKTLQKWYANGQLVFDNAIQRSSGQWGILQKSLLIHSILAGYPIPPVFLLKYKNDDATIYDCIEGKQRLLNTFSFMSWEYALHGGTPDVELDGEVYEIAGRSFDELSDELKDIISGYRYSISVIEDATEEEVEDIFYRLNSPTPLTQIQRSRSVMGTELARWTRDILDKDFFTKAICLTQAQWRREGDLEVLLQTMLLLDNRSENYEYKAISNIEVLKYCSHIRGRFSPEKHVVIEELFDYLSGAFSDKCKFLKKSAVPMVAVIGKLALENSITPVQYRGFIDSFANTVNEEYEANKGNGNVKRVKTEGRLLAMADDFGQYFNISNLVVIGGSAESEDANEAED